MKNSFVQHTWARVSVLMMALCAVMALPMNTAQAQFARQPSPTRPQPQVRTAPPTGPQQADYIVVVVNSDPITHNEVRARLARTLQQMGYAAQQATPQMYEQMLDRMINEKAQLQLAKETGVKIENSAVDQAEQTVARQNQLSVEELHRRLSAEGSTPVQLREDLRTQLTLQRLRERDVEPRVRVSDVEVEQFLQAQKNSPDASLQEVELGHLVLAVPEDATMQRVAEIQQRAQRLTEQARGKDVDFGDLVRQNSDAPNAGSGGSMGMRSLKQYPPLFVQAIQSQPVGAVVGPLRSDAGWHVLKVLDKRQGLQASVQQTHARHILLRTGPKLSEDEALTRLTDYKRRIERGDGTFAALAQEHSQDGSAPRGGDLGWVSPGQFVPEFEEVMNRLPVGEVSAPVLSRFGAHLIEVLERRTQTLSAREQREQVRNMLREKKMEDAYNVWVQEVRGRAYVEKREAPGN